MIASWMLYCALCALGLSLAAGLTERVLLAGRGPVRHVWFGAVVLSVIVPAAALHYAPRAESRPTPVAAFNTPTSVSTVPTMRAHSALPPGARQQIAESATVVAWNWRGIVARADQPLGTAWFALSLGLTLYFFGGVAALAVMRRRWRRHTVLGVRVFVSEHTGPALVGALSPAIVVPEWALAMEPQQLALMLRHEQEHRRARDGQLLTVAHLAAIAMPWNVAVWWQLGRLRAAVELDCDARVLRDADARSYGDLLLEVVRPRRGLRIMGATAFAERATQLERRIRVLARRRDRASGGARALAASIALSAVTVAWVAPRPLAPALASSTSSSPRMSSASNSIGGARAAEPVAVTTPADRPASSVPSGRGNVQRAALADAMLASFQRYGTSGVINPMLMLLRDADSLGLSASQADSIATLNRWYMIRLNGIWSPVAKHYFGAAGPVDRGEPSAALNGAPEASMNLLIAIAPDIKGLLRDDQRSKLPPAIAGYLEPATLAALGAGTAAAPTGVFAPDGGLGGGRGGRGRVGGRGR
jgi:beta-lactamase regulating signal transducer with metallopeptidase domain